MSKIKAVKAERNPWHVKAVEVTHHNIFDIEEWIGATETTIVFAKANAHSKKSEPVVTYLVRGHSLRVSVGSYIVRGKLDDGSYSHVSYSKEQFETGFRGGWS